MSEVTEVPDSAVRFKDTDFLIANDDLADEWKRIGEIYPSGAQQPLLPETFSREQFGQGNHYECFMLSALATLVRFPDIIRNCFVTKKVRQDGRYTFQFFRGTEWVKVEIDDTIAMEDGDVLYCRSPTEHWWPLLLEKAYAKFYTAYDHLEGCTLQETFYDLTGNPVLNIPMDAKLAKAVGATVNSGQYWLSLASDIAKGSVVLSALTKRVELESVGLQSEQQYGVLEIFSRTGSSALDDLVVHLHNPFEDEEYIYKGPLNSKDSTWTPKLRAKYDVEDERSIFLPLVFFLKIVNSVQMCLMSSMVSSFCYFHDLWKGESAGGNPTSVTWRKNPVYLIENNGREDLTFVVTVSQQDQRQQLDPDTTASYAQCGVVLSSSSYPNAIRTFYITGNNHKPLYKSLFLNSREVANVVTLPANSFGYLVPSCMLKGAEGPFTLMIHQMRQMNFRDFSIQKLSIPGVDWAHPATEHVVLQMRSKDRVDFYVDEATDIHILMHQTKPFVSKSGGDAMTEDYMGMYLYDDTDRKIGGVHAATNYRETSVIHHLPRSGRYAISVTCPRAKGDVPAYVTVVGSPNAHVRIVDPPADAVQFDDEDLIDEGELGEATSRANPIDYQPVVFPLSNVTEIADSNTPFEDKRFMVDNKSVTNEPWIHIGDLYPEGKRVPLLPDVLSRDQFEQGDHFECCCLTAYAALVDSHPDVIRNCFVSKNPRKDGRYTFQFHRYGQWVKVEIDDRIPLVDENTLYCRSPTHHWWPLLLEKAYAKFYTLYQNLEGCTLQEVFHDFTGRPVISIPTDPALSKAALFYFYEVPFWIDIKNRRQEVVLTALSKDEEAEALGLQGTQFYSVTDVMILSQNEEAALQDVLIKLYNPFEESVYTGPLNKDDTRWTPELRAQLRPDSRNVIYLPADLFLRVFASIQQLCAGGLMEPCWNFNSEWGEGTNGGNPSLITWRENPLYVVRNTAPVPLQIVAMIRLFDQRHMLHLSADQNFHYQQTGLALAQANLRCNSIPTYLVTMDNHTMAHNGLYVNAREMANIITVPPKSLNYLVASCMRRDKTPFILSFWYATSGSERQLSLERYQPDVAQQLPAIANVELAGGDKDRVDFLVDVPTNIHILLRQERPSASALGASDAIAGDFVGIYLYNEDDKLLKGSQAARNYRETSIVESLPKAGRYAIAVTCPRGGKSVPCRVVIVGTEASHVRLTDPPENARDLTEVDLSFLDNAPLGVPLAELLVEEDLTFQDMLGFLKKVLEDSNHDPAEAERLKSQLNERARQLVLQSFASERPSYLPNRDLDVLNPLLNEDPSFLEMEGVRRSLKKDPRNHLKLKQQEVQLRAMADHIAENQVKDDLSFLGDASLGVPLEDLHLDDDDAFVRMRQTRRALLRDPEANAYEITNIERQMNERAMELAAELRRQERCFLPSEVDGVPVELLPLDADEQWQQMERERRRLTRAVPQDPDAIQLLENQLRSRAAELARELKQRERQLYLPPTFSEDEYALLDADEEFCAKEVSRLQLRQSDPQAHASEISSAEEALNQRALAILAARKQKRRAFLKELDCAINGDLLDELLDEDDDFVAKEKHLQALHKSPRDNSQAIAVLQQDMAEDAKRIASAAAEKERSRFLKDSYEGRSRSAIPIDDDGEFRRMEKSYYASLHEAGADAGELETLESHLNQRATVLAHEMNVRDRATFLPQTVRGVPYEQLPLDDDEEFASLERRRAEVLGNPHTGAKITALEEELRARADELARQRLSDDRAFLDAQPEGLPLACLGVDADAQFTDKEEQRAALVAQNNPSRNGKAVQALETSMNQQVHEIARALKAAQIDECVDPTVHGVPREYLPLTTDAVCVSLMAQRLTALRGGQRSDASQLAEAIKARAAELSRSAAKDVRSRLDPSPRDIPLKDIALDDDETFKSLEVDAIRLLQQPEENHAALEDVIANLNARAAELADAHCWTDREAYLDPEPEGRLLQVLPLDDDGIFVRLERERRSLLQDSHPDAQHIASLEQALNDRAHAIARGLNAEERPYYLGQALRGIPLHALELDGNEDFHELEQARARLLSQNTRGEENAAEVEQMEEKLRAAALAVAESRLQGDRGYLDPRPAGVPLRQVPIGHDPTFQKLEAERASLAGAAQPSAAAIADVESKLNARAVELAEGEKEMLRAKLEQRPQGVPIADLPLDADPSFCAQEEECRDAMRSGDREAQQALIHRLNARADELAEALHSEERAVLEQNPEGMPLSHLALNSDLAFCVLEHEARQLRSDGASDRLWDIHNQLNDRAARLVWAEREKYCDAAPEGIPLENLALGSNAEFVKLEAARHDLLRQGSTSDAPQIQQVEDALNALAHDAARRLLRADRGYLDARPEGVPLEVLPLDSDEAFAQMERARAGLKAADAVGNQRQVKLHEEKLNRRAHELALLQKQEDLRGLDEAPCGVPLDSLNPHEDAEFAPMVDAIRRLKSDPDANATEVEALRSRMNARCRALANMRVSGDRGFLDANPEGVPLALLDLDGDQTFVDLETQRANLKAVDLRRNAAAIAELEANLNDRAHELAKERIQMELSGLDPNPCGIPIQLLKPHEDSAFMASIAKLRGLEGGTSAPHDSEIQPIKDEMNTRCVDLAWQLLRGDRDYLLRNPKDVPLEFLPLDTDPKFHESEVLRAIAKAQNPHRHAQRIQELENTLNVRALELAEARRMKDLEGLDPKPEEVPLAVLDPHSDIEFYEMVKRRRQLEHSEAVPSPQTAAELKRLVATMNDRTHDLATYMLASDRAYLDPQPEGVALEDLPLSGDRVFRSMEGARVTLKAEDPRRNAARIKAMEDELNTRAHELAKEMLADDLHGVDPEPLGIPILLLHPHEDAAFNAFVIRKRNLRASPDVNADAIRETEVGMSARAREMAAEVMDRDFLDLNPENIPLEDLPLDEDPTFHTMEVERGVLKLKNAQRHREAIAVLEGKLNVRAHELARLQWREDLAAVSAKPRGVDKELLHLDSDAQCAAIMAQLRQLKKDPAQNAEAIRSLEDALNLRANEIAGSLTHMYDFLDPAVIGIPLEDLPLSTDEEFQRLLLRRIELKTGNASGKESALTAVEEQLSDRARELAQEVMADDLHDFQPEYHGIPATKLHPHEDRTFADAANKRRLKRRVPTVTFKEDLEVIMDDRLNELALEKINGALYFLDPSPHGMPISTLPLESDSIFRELHQQREGLMTSGDPVENRADVLAAETAMNERAKAIAYSLVQNCLGQLDQKPLGIPLELLHPSEDVQIASLLPELRRVSQSAHLQSRAAELRGEMNDRLYALARSALEGDRATYLDACPEGVPIEELQLGADPSYNSMEVKRAVLRLSDPEGHAAEVEELGERLNTRAHELARAQLQEDLRGVDEQPEGVPLATLRLHNDPQVAAMIAELRVLKKDPVRSANKIKALQAAMSDWAHRTARKLLTGDRGYLGDTLRGVPVTELPLDTDEAFHRMEVDRVQLKAQQAAGAQENTDAIRALEERLKARAEELAQQQLSEDLSGLQQTPLGVPLSLLQLHKDPKFSAKIPQLRRLKRGSPRYAGELQDVIAALDDRALQLAAAYVEKDRGAYLDAEPEGVPWGLLRLSEDPDFSKAERRKFLLLTQSPSSREPIRALEEQLNTRAHAIALQHRRGDRHYLDPLPEDVPLDVLPLDSDETFRSLETKRTAAKMRQATAQMKELEDALNARARALAMAQKEEDLRGLESTVRGIPLVALKPHKDPAFATMISHLRQLKATSPADTNAIQALQAKMNERACEMADAVLQQGRSLINAMPEGVPLERLPLDTDPQFHALEVERALQHQQQDMRRTQPKQEELLERLEARAAELARELKRQDLQGLNAAPRGIPIELLNPHHDAAFQDLIHRRSRAAVATRDPHSREALSLVESLNERAEALADNLLKNDRGYLDRNPRGVPLSMLPLDSDEAFHGMEVERAVLKARDASRNAPLINDLESELNARAHALAQAVLAGDRSYLDPSPVGVDLEWLPLDSDAPFHQMEAKRAKLKAQGDAGNQQHIKEIEDSLNSRAAELARQQLMEDLEGLDREPLGYPLLSLGLHEDPIFASDVLLLRKAKKNGGRGGDHAVAAIQERLNARAEALARARMMADRAALEPDPEGVPLALLPLDSDIKFMSIEKELRGANHPDRTSAKTLAVVERLNGRARELAKFYIDQHREYLDSKPEGIPLSDVPLDADTQFRDLESKRFHCIADAVGSTEGSEVVALEAQLNRRAHELAAEVKMKSRAFLRDKSSGIPKYLLQLDADQTFVERERELRHQAARSPSSRAVKELQAALQARADEIGEMQLKGGRPRYADVTSEGLEISDVPLDTDRAFSTLEEQRAILHATDPTANASAVQEVEEHLRARALELARKVLKAESNFLPESIGGVALAELALDDDERFKALQRRRRAHKRDAVDMAAIDDDEDEMLRRVTELVEDLIAQDLVPLRACYRGIPKEELKLHEDAVFRDLAAKRRRRRAGKSRVEAPDMAMLEEEMDQRACEIADDMIDNERAFLDPRPEGMFLVDVPLDYDPLFNQLEAEHRRRARDPYTAQQNKGVIRELEQQLNRRSHALAREEFAKRRAFMTQEPEGIPLAELRLDDDPAFKEAEIALYESGKQANPEPSVEKDMRDRMNARALELARAQLAADRQFLDPEPEGVPLVELPLDVDEEFGALARERRRRKKTDKMNAGDDDRVLEIEARMNARVQQMAKDFLAAERGFLDREPEGVPVEQLPLNSDAQFRAMERARLAAKREATVSPRKQKHLESSLNARAHRIALDVLQRERAFLDPAPLGVPLDELPLNYDAILNSVERRRRAMRERPKQFHREMKACEDEMIARVDEIARDFVRRERAFMDQEPEGVPLRHLPLNSDKEFRNMELQRRTMLRDANHDAGAVHKLEVKLNDRAHALAKDLVQRGRRFLKPEPLGVPIADVPLNGDELFGRLEEQRRELLHDPRQSAVVKALEDRLNSRAEELAAALLEEERRFMDPEPEGIALRDVPLNTDRRMQEIERTRRHLRARGADGSAAKDISTLEMGMEQRAHELARMLLANDRGFLAPEPCGVPLDSLPLNEDDVFHKMEVKRYYLKKNNKGGEADRNTVAELEAQLDKRAHELAADMILQERAFLDQNPEGIPLTDLPLSEDEVFHSMELERRRLLREGRSPARVVELEAKMNERVHELALTIHGWQDPAFHEANKHVAECWPRIVDLFPDGITQPLDPGAFLGGDVASAPGDVGYLTPFLAAIGRHPVLLQRLMVTTAHPITGPYTFLFFDPNGSPVFVDIDDRVPCDADMVPKFIQSPKQLWYPLLLEKAYAKFVGGYPAMDNCTVHETLRDLTGRPVLHIPFDTKLADAAGISDYTSVSFWKRVVDKLAQGDVIVCSSRGSRSGSTDGIHPQCCYAIMDVIETVDNVTKPSEIVVRLHNSYRNDAPMYEGPLRHGDPNWTPELRRVCKYDSDSANSIFMPLPTFLRNFMSLQQCRINCGDRLTANGVWDRVSAGGNPKLTSFRTNPIFLVENKSTRPVSILVELRHSEPMAVDADGLCSYPQTGIVLLQPATASQLPTPLLTNSTYKIVQRGMTLNAREFCSEMELPPSTTCCVVPYTLKAGVLGSFNLSVYPGMAKVSLTPLNNAGLTRDPVTTKVTLSPGDEGRRVDFTITDACEVHVLLHQNKVTEVSASRKGDVVAEDDVMMSVFDSQGLRITSSGDATNAREHSLAFKATQAGRYALLLTAVNAPVSGNCPCTVYIYTPKRVSTRLVAPLNSMRLVQPLRLPTLTKKKNAAAGRQRAVPRKNARRSESLPPLQHQSAVSGRRNPNETNLRLPPASMSPNR